MISDNSNESVDKQEKKATEKGGRNLVLLGIGSTIIALLTVSISLVIYHNSGDIYLDRSRPGFLPDEEEIEHEEKEDDDYEINKDEKISSELLREYLNKMDKIMDEMNTYDKPFGEEVLSDDSLGIKGEE